MMSSLPTKQQIIDTQTPPLWASASSVRLSEEWLYVHYIMWIDYPEKYHGLPIYHNILFQDHHYMYNDQETMEKVFDRIAFMHNVQKCKVQQKIEKYLKSKSTKKK